MAYLEAGSTGGAKQVRICPSVKSESTDANTDGTGSSLVAKRRPSVYPNANRRRSSFQFKALAVSSMRRQSMATNSDLDCIQKVRYQNTYRTDPNPDTKFAESTVKNAVYEYLAEELTNVKYEEKDWRLKTRDLGDQIRNQVKSLGFERYKIIVEVLINPQCKTNDLIFGSRLLSDPERDRSVTVIFSNDSLSAVVCIYAIYYD